MIERSAVVRWLILSSLAGGFVAATSVIISAGSGIVHPEPTLGIVAFACGTIGWLSATWRLARRWP